MAGPTASHVQNKTKRAANKKKEKNRKEMRIKENEWTTGALQVDVSQ